MGIDKERLKLVPKRTINLFKKYPYVGTSMVVAGALLIGIIWFIV
jgi:hypothetical protein